ncbi:MAG: hypothetical protein ACLFUX_00375 [Spirochaetaceae bacterium]
MLSVGRYPSSGISWPLHLLEDDLGRSLLLSLRLPRVVAGAFLGLALGGAGAVLRMVLAGIAVSALFSAGVGLLKLVADPITQLPALTF